MPHVNALQMREYISPGSISTQVEQTDFILFECRWCSIKLKILHTAERIVLPHNEDRAWWHFLINGNYEEEYLVASKQATWSTQTLYFGERCTRRFIPRYTLFHRVIGVYGKQPATLLCIGGRQGKEPVKYMNIVSRKSYTANDYVKKLQQEREEIRQHIRNVSLKHPTQVIDKGVK